MNTKTKEPKIVTDIDEMLLTVAGKTFLRREVNYFQGQRKEQLFNAYYNREFTYNCDERLVAKIERCLNMGKKIFGVVMFNERRENKFYAYKETKDKVIFIEYELY